MNEATVSQSELDKLLGLEPLEELPTAKEFNEVWIVKNITNHSVVGGRCHDQFEANNLLYKAQKDYPDCKLEVKRLK